MKTKNQGGSNVVALLSSSDAVLKALPDLLPEGLEVSPVMLPPQGLSVVLGPAEEALVASAGFLMIDLCRFTEGGIPCLRALVEQFPTIPIIALHRYDQPVFADWVVTNGAASYLSIDTSAEELHHCFESLKAEAPS
ncbi:MAG: hypothetical protein AAGB22_11495 [Bacteroidota bacterium]